MFNAIQTSCYLPALIGRLPECPTIYRLELFRHSLAAQEGPTVGHPGCLPDDGDIPGSVVTGLRQRDARRNYRPVDGQASDGSSRRRTVDLQLVKEVRLCHAAFARITLAALSAKNRLQAWRAGFSVLALAGTSILG